MKTNTALHSPKGNLIGVVSENQRIQPQGGEKHQPVPRGEEMWYFSCSEMMQHLLCFRHQVLEVEMGEDKRWEKNVKVFLRRKNVVVGELNLAFEVLAAAFGVELYAMLRHSIGFMLVLVTEAVHTRLRSIDKTA